MNEKITKIKEGIVIDHIDIGKVKEVAEILNLDTETPYTLGMNYESGKIGKKDVLKIEGKELDEEDLNKVALIALNATINKIVNYKVVSKRKVELPKLIKGIVRCFNPNCITRYEDVETQFDVVKKNPLILRCYYCEKSSSKVELI
ncbi:MAG: aspartate carbamoyltransferase regulatory subunit [Nanoarchaeota archaeon]|nr:aspartate carbamoyltransferase regulatory subunit [Nanoarchaeota archaeon]